MRKIDHCKNCEHYAAEQVAMRLGVSMEDAQERMHIAKENLKQRKGIVPRLWED